MAYSNGQYPTSATVALSTAPGQRLEATAARQWDALARSVQNTYGWLPYLTDSYRPYTVQERIFRERYRVQSGSGPYGDVRYWQGQRWVRVTGAAAAVPGTSNHGWGKAVDCSGLGGFNGTRFRQLASLAARFGFSNTEGRSVGEAWHWVFTGSYQTSNPVGGGGSVTVPNVPGAPAPISPEDDLTPEQDAALARVWQIAEALVAYQLDSKGRGYQADSRTLGVLPNKKNKDGSTATVLTTAEGQVLRDDIATASARAVAETSAAYHQTIAALSGIKPGVAQVDVAALATALKADLPKAVVAELANALKG